MPSIIKQQILKPLSKFAKNLNPSQIKLSALKGEVELSNLELDEEILMELFELPTWLCIREASCPHVLVKIPWTKLKVQPILVVIESVLAKIEVLEKPRVKRENKTPSYRTSTGRYGFVDRVVDGVSIHVNDLQAELISNTFKACINLSHINLQSMKPNWTEGPLNLTFLEMLDKDALLMFKEVSWESTRFEADGLAQNMTPVKMITNGARFRLHLKKRLSDSSVICGKFHLILENILWVLTISQVEAVILFLNSIKECVSLSAKKNKNMASDKVQQLLSGSFTGLTSHTSMLRQYENPSDSPASSAFRKPIIDPRLMKVYDHYDISENSLSVQIDLIETHFCEDTLRAVPISTQILSNGSVRVTLNGINLQHCPLHLRSASRSKGLSCSELARTRDQWLKSINPDCNPDAFCRHFVAKSCQSATSLITFPPPESAPPTINSIFENITVLRLQDCTVSCVMLEKEVPTEARRFLFGPHLRQKMHSKRKATLDAEQESLISNSFIASDLEMHKLPPKTNLIAIDFTQCFSFNSSEADLPTILFAQLNPLHMKLDVDTVIWLNGFLLNLNANLKSLFNNNEIEPAPTSLPPLFARCEALMPRIIFPLYPPAKLETSSEYPWTGPSALVMQMDTVLIQSLPPPLAQPMASELARVLRSLENQSLREWSAIGQSNHVPIAYSRFWRFADSSKDKTLSSHSLSAKVINRDILICTHLPSVWAEFLTVCEAATKGREGVYKTYRQAFLEPLPVTLWTSARWPLRYRPGSVTRQKICWSADLGRHLAPPAAYPEPISVIVDFDATTNPLSLFNNGVFGVGSSHNRKPLRVIIGHPGAIFTFKPIQMFRLPDAVDHLAFLYGLVYRLSRLKDSMSLDYADLVTRSDKKSTSKYFHEWLLTAKISLERGVQIEMATSDEARLIYPPEDESLDTCEGSSNMDTDISLKSDVDLPADKTASEVNPEIQHNKILKPKNNYGAVSIGTSSSSPNILSDTIEHQIPQLSIEVPSAVGNESVNLCRHSSTTSLSSLDENFILIDEQPSLGYADIVHDSEILLSVDSSDESQCDTFPPHIVSVDDDADNDEIVCEEMGVDITASTEFSANNHINIQDENQTVRFPPWPVDQMILDLAGFSADIDISTMEMRIWIGVDCIDFVDPNQPDLFCNKDADNVFTEPTFAVFLRLGGISLPDQPTSLLTKYDGWIALQSAVLQPATLCPLPTTLSVCGTLLRHVNQRGGLKACHGVITKGPGAGLLPLRNPPELLALQFVVSNGDLLIDLSAKSRGKSLQKFKLMRGLTASLSSQGTLEVCGGGIAPQPNSPIIPAKTTPSTPRRPPPPNKTLRSQESVSLESQLRNENSELKKTIESLTVQLTNLSADLAYFKAMVNNSVQKTHAFP